LPTKFTVHLQNLNVLGCDKFEQAFDELDSLGGVGVTAFGGLREDLPDDGNGQFVDDNSDGENVDVAFPELPIGAIHGENPALGRLWYFAENKSADIQGRQGGTEEECLESTVATFIFCSGKILRREDGEVDRSMPENASNQEGEALDASKIEIEGGC